jgi:L-ascorbate metabolism protein UlaG (beta-lactamase superfamily)
MDVIPAHVDPTWIFFAYAIPAHVDPLEECKQTLIVPALPVICLSNQKRTWQQKQYKWNS